MTKLYITLLAALILLPAAAGAENLVREYRQNGPRGDLEIEIWADNEDGIYYEGEGITILFQANRDCFVAIYTVDTQGDVNLLFPGERWENGFVRGGEMYAIPGDNADYELIVNGPEGIEHIQAVASEIELDIPNWYGGAPIACEDNDDRDDFIEYVNDRYFGCRWDNCERAYDQSLIYVKVQRNYYKPVYVPHHWYDYDRYSMFYIDYPYGAEIYIDGIYFGIAPLWIPRVIYGYHWFTIYDRYGYCWESHINVYHNRTVYLDRSRVKTDRTVVSRYKNLRVQPKKYDRSNYVVSEKKVKSTRSSTYKSTTSKYKSDNYRSSGSKKGYSDGKSSKSTSKSDRYSKKYRTSTKSSGSSKSLWNSSGSKKSNKSSGYKKSSGKSTSQGKAYKPSSSSRKSSSGSKKSGSSVKSGSSKSTGTPKSSGTVKKSGTTKKSGGSKSTGTKKSSGGYKSSSRSTGASSASRVSTSRSTSGKSKSGGRTSGSGEKRR